MNILNKIMVNTVASNRYIPRGLRAKILRLNGMKIASNVRILPDCYFDTNLITIGENSLINRFCQFHDGGYDGQVTIEDNVMVAMNVNFCMISHEIEDENRRAGKSFVKPITIKSGCWVGANSTLLPGVTISEGCIIAAGSVVSKDCLPNGLYAGVPARRIKDLPTGDKKKEAI